MRYRQPEEVKAVYIIAVLSGGHRESYLDVINSVLTDAGMRCVQVRGVMKQFLCPGLLMAPMLEDNSLTFFGVALIRALLGLNSFALMFRPQEALMGKTIRHFLKRLILRLCRRIPQISVYSIVPFETGENLERIADGWIYDLQLWDLPELIEYRDSPPSPLILEMREWARTRKKKVILSLGLLNKDKGFDQMAQMYYASIALRSNYLFLAAGEVDANSQVYKELVERVGGVVINRYVTDSELIELYKLADYIWCCYAPSYDQASGVFGRAYQLGRVPIIRSSSRLEKLALYIPVSVISIPWGKPCEAGNQLATELGMVAASPRESKAINPFKDAARSKFVSAVLAAFGPPSVRVNVG